MAGPGHVTPSSSSTTRTGVAGKVAGRAAARRSQGLIGLQRTYGNRAVGSFLHGTTVQRAAGWPEATGWNKGGPRTIDAHHQLLRVALAGLTVGNTDVAADTAKTGERAADKADEVNKAGARAVVWLHPDLDSSKPVQVVTHLHGFTNRSADPFPGWRETTADPRSDESDAAGQAAAEAALPDTARAARRALKKKPRLARPSGFVNPLGNKVRDVERDQIGQQIEALGDPQVMSVLPQGTGAGGQNMFGAGFDPEQLVGEVLRRLATETEVTSAVTKYKGAPASWTIVASAHSGGGAALAGALRAKRTGHVGGLILFDALWAQPKEDDPTTWLSSQRDAVLAWVRANCSGLAVTLKSSQPAAEKDAALAALPGVHGYYTGGVYQHSYEGLEAAMHKIVDDTLPPAYAATARDKFRIRHVTTSHDRMLGKVGASTPGVAPLEESLRQRTTFVARQPAQQPPTPPVPPTPPAPPQLTPQQQAEQAADRVRDAVIAASAPLVGTPDAADLVDTLTLRLVRRRTVARPAANAPTRPLYDVLVGATVTADLTTIDTALRNRARPRDTTAADTVRRRMFMAVLDAVVTDAQPRTAVAAPTTPLDPAVQIPAERAMVPRVLPFIDSNRSWEQVRIGVITEFGGLVDGTRTALARADAYYGQLVAPRFRNVTGNTRVHPDMNAAFARAETWLAAQLALLATPRRTAVTTEITTVLGRGTWSANLRENRNSPYRLSDHSFGLAIDFDSSHNPNISDRGGLDAVQDVTGDNPRAARSIGRTASQVEVTAADLRSTSDDYEAAMTDATTLAPVLLRLANDGRARTTPPLPALTDGGPLVTAILVADDDARKRALRAVIWPEAPAPATPPAPPPAPAGRGRRRPAPAPALPPPPPQVATAETKILLVGRAFRESFADAARTRRVGAATEATRGSVAADGFLTLPSLLVGAAHGQRRRQPALVGDRDRQPRLHALRAVAAAGALHRRGDPRPCPTRPRARPDGLLTRRRLTPPAGGAAPAARPAGAGRPLRQPGRRRPGRSGRRRAPASRRRRSRPAPRSGDRARRRHRALRSDRRCRAGRPPSAGRRPARRATARRSPSPTRRARRRPGIGRAPRAGARTPRRARWAGPPRPRRARCAVRS